MQSHLISYNAIAMMFEPNSVKIAEYTPCASVTWQKWNNFCSIISSLMEYNRVAADVIKSASAEFRALGISNTAAVLYMYALIVFINGKVG